MKIFYTIRHWRKLRYQYMLYIRMVELTAQKIYLKPRRKNITAEDRTAAAHAYLRDYHIGFFAWVKKVRNYGG